MPQESERSTLVKIHKNIYPNLIGSLSFSPRKPNYPIIDESLTKDVSNNLKIIKTKIWEPYQWAEKWNKNNKKFKSGQFDIEKNQNWKTKLSIWIRGNFFIPDARIFGVKPSISYWINVKKNKIDALVTTGPPHSYHLIGLQDSKINFLT